MTQNQGGAGNLRAPPTKKKSRVISTPQQIPRDLGHAAKTEIKADPAEVQEEDNAEPISDVEAEHREGGLGIRLSI